MIKQVLKELNSHAPFTVFGAISGIVMMLVFQKIPSKTACNIFFTLHPIHVFLSALVTAAIYKCHTCPPGKHIKGKCNLWLLFIIGYIGSVGIATISDSIIPYLGEILLDLPNRGIHLGFIEKWWLVNPLAILGIVVAYLKPATKFPHAGHILISTWASLFHIIMAIGGNLNMFSYGIIFVFLFLAVWLPCCVSDFVFPLIFVKENSSKRDNIIKTKRS